MDLGFRCYWEGNSIKNIKPKSYNTRFKDENSYVENELDDEEEHDYYR